MKTIAIISLLLICSACFANEIDKLKTNNDVQNFLATRVSKYFKNDYILGDGPNHQKGEGFGNNRFFKLDFDRNGLTDLIIDGARLIVVLDSGQNKFEAHELCSGTFFLNHVKLMQIDSLVSPKRLIIQQEQKPKGNLDTLVYLFQDFIEYNRQPEMELNFETINIQTSRCFGECPIFQMTINKNRTARYHAEEYNDEEGEFRGILAKSDFTSLTDLLKYLKIETLNNNYEVPWTDDQTVTLKIKYDGKTKTISDYGKIGSYGLAILYKQFFAFRNKVNWQNP